MSNPEKPNAQDKVEQPKKVISKASIEAAKAVRQKEVEEKKIINK